MNGAAPEIARDREQAARAFDYHQELLGAIAEGEKTINLRPATLTDTVQATGFVPDLPFPVVQALSEIHDVQETYLRLNEVNLSLLYFGSVFTDDALGYASDAPDLQIRRAPLG